MQNTNSKTRAFIHANVIPMDEERMLSDQTVIVRDGHIAEIGDSSRIDVPGESIVVDAIGQYMIPALADMHIHLEGEAWNVMFPPEAQFSSEGLDFSKILFPYIANGVTMVQVMSAFPEHIQLRDQINRGEILGPRLILHRLVDGPDQAWPPPLCTWVATEAEARQAVFDAKEAGYDGMKVYSFLSPECYDAILTTAEALHMPVIGHIPSAMSMESILAAGQILIAHAEEVMKQAHGDFSAERIDYFAGIIAGSDTWITPTLITTRNILAIFDDLARELARPEMCALHPMAKGIWSFLTENIYLKMPPEQQQFIRQGFESFQRPLTKALWDKGVKLLAGTDALVPTNIPGFSLHDELKELQAVGLTPYEALLTATTHPIEYLGELHDAGTIEVGKRADLLLLEANPLEEISNTKKIMGLLYGARWLDREEMDIRMNELCA